MDSTAILWINGDFGVDSGHSGFVPIDTTGRTVDQLSELVIALLPDSVRK